MASTADPQSRQAQTMIERAACFAYIETTIAPGITLSDYRCSRPARRRWRLGRQITARRLGERVVESGATAMVPS